MDVQLSAFKALRRWQIGVLLTLLVAIVGSVYGVYRIVYTSDALALAENEQLLVVQTDSLVNDVSTDGSLSYPVKERLTFGTKGIAGEALLIGKVFVEEGDQVIEGQPLVSLDEITADLLKKAVAQARINVQKAKEALKSAQEPYTILDVAKAEAKVSDAKLSLRTAQDALTEAQTPSSVLDIAKAEARVSDAKLSLRTAQDALTEAQADPTQESIIEVQADIDAAVESLELAKRDLILTQDDWKASKASAQEDISQAGDVYSDVYTKYLGIQPTDTEKGQTPEVLLASWDVDLNSIFAKSAESSYRLMDNLPADDPATLWDESIVYAWLNFFLGPTLATCEDGIVPKQGICIKNEIDDTWAAYETTVEVLETMQLPEAKALSAGEAAVRKAEKALSATEDTMADLLDKIDTLDTEVKEKQLAVAQANLDTAKDDLTDLLDEADTLDIEVKEKQLAIAQANLDTAKDDLTDLLNSIDQLEVALKEAELASAQVVLSTALHSLENTTLLSPLTGVVTSLNVEADEEISPNTFVIEVADYSVVEVDGIIDEIDVLFVRPGQLATVTMDALPGAQLRGVVSYIATSGTNQQGVVSYPIHIEVQVPEGEQLLEGLSATASIVLRQEDNVLLVPQQAVYGTFDDPYVHVSRNGGKEEQPVVLGNSDDFWVVVRQGLNEGDQIVMESQGTGIASQFNFRPGGGFVGGGFGGGRFGSGQQGSGGQNR